MVAANPVSRPPRGSLDPTVVEEQRRIFLKQAEDKPEQIRAKIAEGQAQLLVQPRAVLLDQMFVKDSAKTVRDMIMETNARVGENISIARFARFIVGDSATASDEAPESEG